MKPTRPTTTIPTKSRAETLEEETLDKLPVTDHLEELRWRIVKCLIAIGVGFVGTYAFARQIFNYLVSPLVRVMPEDGQLIWDPSQIPVEDFNRRLKKLRKRAKKKAKNGKGVAVVRAARRRWGQLEALGAKDSCCGKDFDDRCSRCPRSAGELVLAPLE